MKNIGFIDHYIDEWHANNYPAMIRRSKLGGNFKVAMAWDEGPSEGRKPLEAWGREQDVAVARSLAEVVETCDCLVVLAPDSPERQEQLAGAALRSGKPVYIDKPCTARRAGAERCWAKAKTHGTPIMSCSALRFAPQLTSTMATRFAGARPLLASAQGPGKFDNYAIHQLEMVVRSLGCGARRAMYCRSEIGESLVLDYPDKREGPIRLATGHDFGITLGAVNGESFALGPLEGFFEVFIDEMLRFFETGHAAIPEQETIEVLALVETGLRARSSPNTWIDVVN